MALFWREDENLIKAIIQAYAGYSNKSNGNGSERGGIDFLKTPIGVI